MPPSDKTLFPPLSQPSTGRCGATDLWCKFDINDILPMPLTGHNAAAFNHSFSDSVLSATSPLSSGFPSASIYDLLMTSLADANDTDADFETQLQQLLVNRRSANQQLVSDGFKTAVDGLNLYVTPIIIAIGVIGNALSLAVFSLTHLRRLSSSFYLSTLSVADIVFLVSLIVVWLQRVNVDLFASDGWCQSILYATRVSEFLASWYVVSFTAERYVTVYYPLRKDSFCTRRRARLVVTVITSVACAFYLPTFWTYDVIAIGLRSACAPLPQHQYVMSALTGVDLIVSCFVPSIAVVALNVRIIAKIHRYQKVTLGAARIASNMTTAAVAAPLAAHQPLASASNRRRSLVHTSVSASGSMHIKFTKSKMMTVMTLGNHRHPSMPLDMDSAKRMSLMSQQQTTRHKLQMMPCRDCQHSVRGCGTTTPMPPPQSSATTQTVVNRRLVRGQSQLRTARMLLILSSVIVLLNLPTHLFRVQAIVHQLMGGLPRVNRDRFTWQELFQIVQFTNFAVNFFVYSLCGRQFRIGLAQLCSRQRIHLHRCAYQISKSTCCCCKRYSLRRSHRERYRTAKFSSRKTREPAEVVSEIGFGDTAAGGTRKICCIAWRLKLQT